MDESVQEFWDNMEKEVGEKVLVRCLGQCISGHPDIKRERWGIFFLTGSAFYFKTFKEEPGFLSALVKRKRKGEDDVKEMFFGIPFDAITGADLPKPKTFFRRLVSKPDEQVSFTYDDGTGARVDLVFTVATEQDKFFKVFETLLP